MESIYINDDNKVCNFEIEASEVIIDFFEPGRFANMSVEHDGKASFEKHSLIGITNCFLETEEKNTKVILHIPNTCDKENLSFQIKSDNIVIKNANTDMAMFLHLYGKNLRIEDSKLKNSRIFENCDATMILYSDIKELEHKSYFIDILVSHIDLLKQYNGDGYGPFRVSIRSNYSKFNHIIEKEVNIFYMDEGRFNHMNIDHASQMYLNEVECGDISLNRGNIYLRNCLYKQDNKLDIESGTVTLNVLETNNIKVKKEYFKRKINILEKDKKIYSINKNKNVKVKMLKYN